MTGRFVVRPQPSLALVIVQEVVSAIANGGEGDEGRKRPLSDLEWPMGIPFDQIEHRMRCMSSESLSGETG